MSDLNSVGLSVEKTRLAMAIELDQMGATPEVARAVLSVLTTSSVDRVVAALDRIGDQSEEIQEALTAYVTTLQNVEKRLIVEDRGLARIFSHSFGGVDRRRLVAWLHAFTPIRIRFEKNGQFKDVAFAKDPKWNLEGMLNTPWTTFEPHQTKPAAAGSFDSILSALVWQLARAAADEGFGLIGARDKLISRLNEQSFMDKVVAHVGTDKFKDWEAGRAKAKREAAQAAGPRAVGTGPTKH